MRNYTCAEYMNTANLRRIAPSVVLEQVRVRERRELLGVHRAAVRPEQQTDCSPASVLEILV